MAATPGQPVRRAVPVEAEALLLKLRPHIAYFNSSKFISDLSNGNICGAMLEGKATAEQAGNGVKIAYSLPKEGAPVWFDTLVLLKDAAHPQQGLAFIDYLMRADVIAPVSYHLNYPNGNRNATALVAEATRNNPAVYPSAEALATLFTLQPLPPAAYESKRAPTTGNLSMINNDHISELSLAATEAMEEAIINVLLAADSADGNGHAVPGLDARTLLDALHQAGWPGNQTRKN